jgi:hypothetical protein
MTPPSPAGKPIMTTCPHCQQRVNTHVRWQEKNVAEYRVRETVCDSCYRTISTDLVHHTAAPTRRIYSAVITERIS